MKYCSSLPKLSYPPVFDPTKAQIDKLEVMLGDWVIAGPEDEVSNVLRSIAEMSYENPAWPNGQIFQFGTLSTVSKSNLKFKGTGTGRGTAKRPRLLFSGQIEVAPLSRTKMNEDEAKQWTVPSETIFVQVKLRLKLNLNLIRFIQAQPVSFLKRKTKNRRRSFVLAINPKPPSEDGEKTIVYDTNVVIGGGLRTRYADSKAWSEHLTDYFREFEQFFTDGIRKAVRSGKCTSRQNHYLSIRKLEICWEFRSNQPIQDVINTGSQMEQITASSNTLTIGLGDTTYDTRAMSRRYAVNFENSLRLRIYPKTTKRVRFEAVHDAKSLSAIVKRRSYTGTDQIDKLIEWINAAVDASIERTAATVRQLNDGTRPATGLLPPHRLIHRICTTVPDQTASGAPIDSLVNEGCIRLNDLNPFSVEVRKLRKAGVLEPSAQNKRVFHVTSKYGSALAKLRK